MATSAAPSRWIHSVYLALEPWLRHDISLSTCNPVVVTSAKASEVTFPGVLGVLIATENL